MSTGDGFEDRIDYDESLERVKQEGGQGALERVAERLRALFR